MARNSPMAHLFLSAAVVLATSLSASAQDDSLPKGAKLTVGREGIVRPDAAIAVPYRAPAWTNMSADSAEHKRLVESARAIAQARDGLAELLWQRRQADGADEKANVDVLLELSEAFVTCANQQVRPMPSRAPQWRDLAGRSLSRIHDGTMEIERGREDVQILFQKRGNEWMRPRLGMLTSKFLAAFHYKGSEGPALEWTDSSFAGKFSIASSGGDRRYQMHHSGEGSTATIPEFRHWLDFCGGYWPDWWLGPRERLGTTSDSFTIAAGERRGWLLKARLVLAEPATGLRTPDSELFAWIEDGRVLRGYAIVPGKLPGRGPELLVNLDRWSLKDRTLEAEFTLGSDASATNRSRQLERWALRASLPGGQDGGFTGDWRALTQKADPVKKGEWTPVEKSGVLEGALYRAYAGTYTATGVDGPRTGRALAGVAAVTPVAKVNLPEARVAPATPPSELFAGAIALAEQVAALDWALREYPLPLEETMRLVSNGCDDRFRYYPGYLQWFIKTTRASGADRDVLPKVRPHMHEAMAAMMGADAGGAAAYAARLADVARAALAGHTAGTAPAVGIGTPVDGDFGPYLALRMARCEQGVNAIPAAGADGEARWDTLDDWTCHGFVARVSSFETGPYLPELPIVPGLRPGGRELEVGKPVRLLQQDPSEHLWAWRARPDPIEGRVTIPRECLLLAKADEDRRRFSGSAGAGVKAETLDFYYNTFVTWYATSQVASEKRQRIHMAARIEWDGRVWVNDRLVWRPSREHTPDQVAVFPVDLEPGVNRVTVGCSMRQLGDGNTGDPAARIYEYGELAFGSFTVWVAGGDAQPRSAEAVAHARAKQTAWDKDRATARSARGIRGRRGDGTGLYRDAKPPVAWDIDKGINIRWKKMIRTDDAEPVIQGGRLFVTTYTGEAVCLDAQTGDELWRKKPQTPGNTGASAYPPAAITASFGQSARMWRKDVPATLTPHAAYARSCLTPVADARHVWMHDPRGTVACFDHDGKQLWARSVAAQTPRFTEGGYLKQRLLPPTHPSVAGSKLIVAVAAGLSAFDLESGKLAWERPSLDYLGQFAVMGPVDGAGDGLVLLSSGEVLDADTGKTLIARVVPLIPDGACEPVVDGRTAWFGAASTAVRFWRTASGALCGRVLWHTSTDIKRRQHDLNHHNGDLGAEPRSFSRSSAYPPTPVLMDGLLYEHMGEQMSIDHGPQQSMRLHTWDAATGCAVSQRYGVQLNATHPVTSTVIAGGMIFCADEGGFGKGDYPGFPQEPSIVILTAEEQPRRVTRHQPGLATMSPPTFQGECMYLAGEDQVVCVGRPKERGERFTEHELAALRQTFFALEVGEPPATGADQAQPIAPLADAGLAKGAPVVRLVGGKCPDRWLYAGPFLVSENTDVFKDAGGAGALHPEPGQTMRYTKADGTAGEVAFVMLDDIKAPDKKPQEKKLIDAAYAKILGNPSLEGGINLATASGRQYFTTSYACTVVEVTQPGRYRVEMHAGRIQSADLFLGGRRVEPDTTVELSAGRYPLMLRAAIGICGNWEPIQWAVVFIALPAAGPVVPPEPLAGPLPAGLRTPVAPLILASLPPRMLGAWPLDGPIQGNPYERMSGQSGSLIGEGTRITHGGKAVEFRPLPPGAIDTVGKRGVSDGLHLNVRVNVGYQHGVVEELGLAERAIFGDTSPSAGLFFAVLSNPRTVCVKLRYSANTRCWLSGREVPPYITIQLKPGLYPFLLEYRSDKRHDAAVLPLVFQEVADPAIEQRLWLGRVRCNADMLRRIAESGPAGVYVKPALDALGP